MRYFVAVAVITVEFFLYSILGAALGWKHGGGAIPLIILVAVMGATWSAITKPKSSSP